MKKLLLILSVALVGLSLMGGGGSGKGGPQGGSPLLGLMEKINEELVAQGAPYRVNEVDAFVVPRARAINERVLQEPLRWVPNDSRRFADGISLTYLVDLSDGKTASGLSSAQTEAAIDRAMATWDTEAQCSDLPIVKRADTGADPDIVDSLIPRNPRRGFGSFGNPFLADITHAGWLPKAFFDALEPDGGDFILGVAFQFIFVGGNGPTDINNDQYLDTALVEIYYNDNFGRRGGTRRDNPWGIDAPLPGIDVETVALHESGHGLSLGHFRPPPEAVMNPTYAGIQQTLLSTDNSANCTLYGSWPNP